MKWILPLCLMAPPVCADVCPPAPDHSERLAQIIMELGAASGPDEANILNNEAWSLWTDAPDERAQTLLDEGMSKRSIYDFLGARDTFDVLVEYCPNYAEGYNQRAFASYLRSDYDAALIDLDRALEITPDHIAALSGKALTLIGLERHEEAQDVLRAALALNPWLAERALLTEPAGTDL